jgi:Bacterial PH domain
MASNGSGKGNRMSYAQETLQPGEKIRHHIRIWLWPKMVMCAVCAFVAYRLFEISNKLYYYPQVQSLLAHLNSTLESVPDLQDFVPLDPRATLFILGLLSAIAAIWFFKRSGVIEFTITDRRVIYKEGLIRRSIKELHLYHVDGIVLSQSILGRIFGGGHIEVSSTGGMKIRAYRSFVGVLDLRRMIMASQLHQPVVMATAGLNTDHI